MKTIPLHPTVRKTMEKAAARRDKFRALKASGLSYQQIADREGVSKQRVHQILNKPE